MSDENAKIRAKLEARLEALEGRLAEMNETLREPADDDFEEQATELDDDDVLEHLSHAARIEASFIAAAMKRIDEGTYGKCIDCGKPIARRRLRALPEAERCLSCAQEFGAR